VAARRSNNRRAPGSWPGREQLRQSTAVVLIIVLTLAAYVAAWDFLFGRLARLIFT
jgi:preprotein translocase SecE subunit